MKTVLKNKDLRKKVIQRIQQNEVIGKIMDVLNPLVVRVMGANINRRTVENVQTAGWSIAQAEDLGMGGIVKLIVARA